MDRDIAVHRADLDHVTVHHACCPVHDACPAVQTAKQQTGEPEEKTDGKGYEPCYQSEHCSVEQEVRGFLGTLATRWWCPRKLG